MTKNSQIFLDIFKRIENHLRKNLNAFSEDSVHKLIDEAAKTEPVIMEYKSYLHRCTDLRNSFSHNPPEELIMEASEGAVQKLQRICDKLLNPPTAYQISSKPVFKSQTDDFLFEIMKDMKKEIYTHVPIYEGDEFIGVLSESSVFNWLEESDFPNRTLENIKIGDIKKYLDIENRSNEYFEFVSQDTSAYIIKEWFAKAIKGNKRLGAVFVTENGKENEKLLGVITAWDLPRMESQLNLQ